MESKMEEQADEAISSPANSSKSQWRSLFRFTRRSHILVLVFALIFAVLSGIIIPALAFFLGKAFSAFTSYGAGISTANAFLRDVAQNAIYLVILGLSNSVFSALFLFFWLVFGELQAKKARHRLYAAMLEKEMEWFDMRRSGISALMPRVQSLIRELQLATSQPLGFLVQYTSTILAAIGLAFYSAWDLTLIVIASAPIGAFVLATLSKRLQPHIKRQSEHLELATKYATAALSAIETVKCANGQDFELGQFLIVIKAAALEYAIQAKVSAAQFGFVRFLTLAIFVQGFWYGSHLVQSGSKSSGQILTAFWACLIATQTFEALLQHLLVLEKGRTAGETLHSIVRNIDSAQKLGNFDISPDHCDGDVQLTEVSFAYPAQANRMVLNRVNMFFAAGETSFIVGHSGSGKSTLANLLLGFYSAKGLLTIDGNPIDRLDRDWLRNNITVMQQQSVLFNESILRNISFGLREFESVDATDLAECIRYAALEDTILNFPKGINTIVGPGGNLLSGGQKQRVSFARAKLRDSPILIFDEATSALDKTSSEIVMQSIRSWRKNKTTIIITHDLSQVLPEDYVYVVDQGRVVQEGYRQSLDTIVGEAFHGLSGQRNAQEKVLTTIMEAPISPVSVADTNDHIYPGLISGSDKSAGQLSSQNTKRQTMKSTMSVLNHSQETTPAQRRLSQRRQQGPDSQISHFPNRMPMSPSMLNLRNSIDMLSPQIKTVRYDDLLVETVRYEDLPDQCREDTEAGQENTNRDYRIETPTLSFYAILSTIWPSLTRRQRMLLICGCLAAIAHAVSTPIFSWIFSKLLATFFNSDTNISRSSLTWSMAILGVAISDGIISYLMHYLFESQAQNWVDTLRSKAYERILDQPRAWFNEDRNKTQRLVECLDRSAEEMRNLLGRFLGPIIVSATMVSVAITWSLILSWKLTLVGLACGPFIYALTGMFNSMNARWEKKCNEASQPVSESFTETFGNIRTVRALTLDHHFHRKHAKVTRQAMATGIKRAIYSGFFFGVSDATILFVIALLFWYSSTLVAYQGVSVQTIITVVSMLLFTLSSAASMMTFIPQLNSSRETATQLLELVNLPFRTSHEYAGNTRPQVMEGSIMVKNLTFTYPSRPQTPAIRNLSLQIQLGKSTAIVGASGSGKSTLIALLLGLYPTDKKDAIIVSSHALSDIDTSTLRQIVALSPQYPPILPTTIKANIAYALPEKSPLVAMENIVHAAQLAGIHTFIRSLPEGYDTLIGEGGSLLSGGQTARIGLARAICRQPRILILDEPTAGLDGISRGELVRTIQGLAKTGVTVIVVTHDEILRNGCEFVVELQPKSSRIR